MSSYNSKHELDSVLGTSNFRRLARQTGYTRQHLSRGLRGIAGLSRDCVDRLATAVDMSEDEIREYLQFKRDAYLQFKHDASKGRVRVA